VRILFVCHRLPFPPARGGKIRPFHVIRHLSERHDVTVASLARSVEELEAGKGLNRHCSRVIVETVSAPAALARMVARVPTSVPASMGYFYSSSLVRRIRREVASTRFDLIFVHCAFVAPYVADVPAPTKTLDFGDMDSQKWLAYARVRALPLAAAYYVDGIKLRRAETRLARSFDLCTCTTRAELAVLESYGVGVRLGWFPNGVDAEYFQPGDAPYRPDSICFVGRMDYYPNQQCVLAFCRDVLPLVRARRPSATLAIVGAAPSRAIRSLGGVPGVTVTGSVGDVRPYLRAAAVSVAPLTIARGTQNKILEAMAMGVPTVASVEAAKGVDAEPGRHLLTGSTPRDYAEAIVRVLGDASERGRLSEAARARVLSHHSWSHSMRVLDRLIEECCSTRAGRGSPTTATKVSRNGELDR
jgi:sugar transferase (PEP-CTERM/EpsH1 system associated)